MAWRMESNALTQLLDLDFVCNKHRYKLNWYNITSLSSIGLYFQFSVTHVLVGCWYGRLAAGKVIPLIFTMTSLYWGIRSTSLLGKINSEGS